ISPYHASDELLDAMEQVESSNGTNLVSKAGAIGPYQFMRDTAKQYGLKVAPEGVTPTPENDERFDEAKSRAAAARMMHDLLHHYQNNVYDALLAYNWGMGNVDQWIKQGRGEGYTDKDGKFIPMPKETREYVGNVVYARHHPQSRQDAADFRKYHYQQLQQAQMPANAPVSVDNSQTTTTYISNVNLSTTPQNMDALAKDAIAQQRRAGTNQQFASAVR
ncbi:transglycosylase SLT domain-containing protein, partial [Escherichia coli]|nr:transglycosylase SLT domain-containing protein [Escherichia coli]